MADLGNDGNDAPEGINGIPYHTFVSIQGRINTIRGLQLMNPTYGSEVYKEIHRKDLPRLERAIAQTLVGIEGLERFRVMVDATTRNVSIAVRGV